MRRNRIVALAVVAVALLFIAGCSLKPNPLAPEVPKPCTTCPPDTTEVCILVKTTATPADTIPGDDSYLGSPGAKSNVIDNVQFGGDSSTVAVIWALKTVDRANYNFSIIGVDKSNGDVIHGVFDGGATRLNIGYRSMDTTVVARFHTGNDGNGVLGHRYQYYTIWNVTSTATAGTTGAQSILCHAAGKTWVIYEQWDRDCHEIIRN